MKELVLLISISAWVAASPQSLASNEDDVSRRSRRLHFSSIVLDTHVDTTLRLREPDWDFSKTHGDGHADLPRIKEGGLNTVFFSIFMPGTVTGDKAVHDSFDRIASIYKLVEELSDEMSLCTTLEEIQTARSEGKIAVLMGMEGGHMINNSLSVLGMYARLGIRYLTLTHSVNTEWADSSNDEPQFAGLTVFGRKIVKRLNHLGIMVDVSHVSDKTFWDTLETSEAPLIASHSSCRALSPHRRNMSDEMISALAAKGGVIQITFVDQFLDNLPFQAWEKSKLVKKASEQGNAGNPDLHQDQSEERPKVGWERILDHIDHAVKVAGVDHVGLGSDFDGATMPQGMDDVSHLPRITEGLLRRGYSEDDVRKILGENTLRLMGEVEEVSRHSNPPSPE